MINNAEQSKWKWSGTKRDVRFHKLEAIRWRRAAYEIVGSQATGMQAVSTSSLNLLIRKVYLENFKGSNLTFRRLYEK